MKERSSGRDLVPSGHVAAEARALREEAASGYTELHLLAAALQEHIDDLRKERDRLLTQVARMRDDARRADASWLERGMKKNR